MQVFRSRCAAEFIKDDDGAVTVDWVVLTASIVALGGLAVAAITGSMGTVGSKISTFMAARSIESTF